MEEVRPPAGVDSVITEALRALTRIPAVGRAGIALTEGAGRRLLFTASDRPGPALDWCHIDAFDDVPLTWVVRSGRPISGTLPELAERFPEFVAHQAGTPTTALIATPLESSGTRLGGVVVFVHGAVPLADLSSAVTSAAGITAMRLGALRAAATRRSQPSGPAEDALLAPSFTISEAKDVGDARRLLRRLLAEQAVDAEAVDDALLCLSEVLANVVMHTDAPAGVYLTRADGLLRVTVRDGGNHLGIEPQPVRPVEPTAVHGRGLQILEALSSRWGSDTTATGAAVWFELDLRQKVTARASRAR